MKTVAAHVLVVSLVGAGSCRLGESNAGSRTDSDAASRRNAWSQLRDSVGMHALREDPKPCSDCIVVEQLARLGTKTDSGDAYVTPTFQLLRDNRGNFWLNQGTSLKVFAADGRFLRLVGRPGKGPMEWGRPWPVASDAHTGNVRIIDKTNGRETVVSAEGRHVSDKPIVSMDINHVVSLDSGSYLMNAWGTTPRQVAEPLHVVRGLDVVRSFGASQSGEPVTPFTARRVIAVDRDGHVFSARDYDYEVEVWTKDGQRIFGLAGPLLNRVPVKPVAYNRDDNPIPQQIQSVWADESARLWVVIWRVRPDWKDKLEDRLSPDGRKLLVPKKGIIGDSIYSTRIDVIELESRSIVGRVDLPGLVQGWAGPGILWQNVVNNEKPEIRILQLRPKAALAR